ncbi:MAG: Rrf2 family transcriptional regulator, partial [Terriglobia bacterium]
MRSAPSARELARCAEIPPAQAAKILYLLTWAGFVSSRRGFKGGFWLRVPARHIRVKDVMEFFHPPVERG